MAYEGKLAREFADLPIVQRHVQQAAQVAGEYAAQEFFQNTSGALKHAGIRFDSPLELLFWVWWEAVTVIDRLVYPYSHISLEQQVWVDVAQERFRLDFVVGCNEPRWARAAARGAMPTWPLIAVEVDGHEFHERTPEQVARRDSRDRALQNAGWRVFHFSWSEFTSQSRACVEEVYYLTAGITVDFHRRYSLEVPEDIKGE